MYEFSEPPGENDEKEDIIRLAKLRFSQLVELGMPLEDIADVLNAQDLLIKEGSGRSAYITFDIDRFLQRELQKFPELMLMNIEYVDMVILPPGEGEFKELDNDTSNLWEQHRHPRIQLLAKMLSDVNIDYRVVCGKVVPKMVRQESYVVFILRDQNKLVFVTNEAHNATYIIGGVHAPEEAWREWAARTKSELRAIDDGTVARLLFVTEDAWLSNIKHAIETKDLFKKSVTYTKEIIPERWASASSLAKIMAWRRERAVKTLKKYAKDFKDDVLIIESDDGVLLGVYGSPEIVEQIKNDFAYEKWLGIQGLAESLGISDRCVLVLMKKYIDVYPELIIVKHQGSIARSYFNPEILKKEDFVEEAKLYLPAPLGWLTEAAAARLLHRDRSTLHARTKKIKVHHPDWFRSYASKGGREEHLSPELIELLQTEIENETPPPEDWLQAKDIAELLGVSIDTIYRRIKKLEKIYPDLWGHHLTPSGKMSKWYSPLIVQNLQDALKKS